MISHAPPPITIVAGVDSGTDHAREARDEGLICSSRLGADPPGDYEPNGGGFPSEIAGGSSRANYHGRESKVHPGGLWISEQRRDLPLDWNKLCSGRFFLSDFVAPPPLLGASFDSHYPKLTRRFCRGGH